MSAPPDHTEALVRPAASSGANREVLAALLLDIARNVQPELHVPPAPPTLHDPAVRQLRSMLLGGEIELLKRLSRIIEDPERLAEVVGRILPTAVAHASGDGRLGQVLAPTVETAAQKSIRNDPRTLVNILYPLIVPAIRKSIVETIDQTFESLNAALKHGLSWRGLKWRWEAWRTGRSFAEVVLNHSLVYQVEHVFLIHRHTGLLISHLSAENAASQDPQLVSSMLTAIQDFVRDSFSDVGQQELDSLRLGNLLVWSTPGPVATLVAVIRGKPPEELHQILSTVITRIHADRHQALEDFDGDSSGLTDIEAELAVCAAMRQAAPQRTRGFPWLVALIALVVLALTGTWLYQHWQDRRQWADFVLALRSQPGVVITDARADGDGYRVSGLRDPLAIDPEWLATQMGVDPRRIIAHWAPYQALDPPIVLRRLQSLLDPPASVAFALDGNRVVAHGSAHSAWLERARFAIGMLPVGAPSVDISAVNDLDAGLTAQRRALLAELRAQPGIAVIGIDQHDGRLVVTGLRDPLAADPQPIVTASGLNPNDVKFRWSPYEALDPPIVLRRLEMSLTPLPAVTFKVEGDRIVATGAAPALWLDRARVATRMLPAGAPTLDLSGVSTVNDAALAALRNAIQSRNIRFNQNDALPAPGQDALLDQLAKDLTDMAALASTLRVSTRVRLTGHADAVGQETLNLSLSLARAEVVRSLLRKRGVNPDQLAVRAAGALEPLSEEATDAARSLNRRVSFNVDIEAQP